MLSKNKLKEIKSLHLAKFRKEENLFLVEGPKVVAEFIESDFVVKEIFATSDWIIGNSGLTHNILCHEIGEDDLKKISLLSTPNKVLAVVEMKHFELPEDLSYLQQDLNIVLDTIQDPGNMGTIIRIADWFGIQHIFASKESVDFYNPKVVQSAMGSLKRVKIIYCDLPILFNKSANIPVYGALLEGKNLYEEKIENKGLLIIGNESKGISNELLTYINKPLKIPFYSNQHAESLNAAIASGIIISEFRRQKFVK